MCLTVKLAQQNQCQKCDVSVVINLLGKVFTVLLPHEAALVEAKDKVAAWEHSLATDGVVQTDLWGCFSQRAPDALMIKTMTMKAEEQRVECALRR